MRIAPAANAQALNHPHSLSSSQLQDVSLSGAAYQTRQSSITMKTEEGDIITISAAAAAAINLDYSNRQSSEVSGGINFTASLMQGNSMEITVQGDLSDEELADIKKLLQDLHKVSTAFYAGNMEASIKHALAIGDMGSIKELEATFQNTAYTAAAYTANYHPLPENISDDLQQLQNDLAEALGSDPTENFGDMLQAQWQQLLEYLQENDNEAPAVSTPPQQEEVSITGLLQQMQQLIDDTVSKHPRISPLILPVAENALQNAADEQQVPADIAARNSRSILQQLHGWLLAV